MMYLNQTGIKNEKASWENTQDAFFMPVGDVKLQPYTINLDSGRRILRHFTNARLALVTTVTPLMLLPVRFTFPTTFDRGGCAVYYSLQKTNSGNIPDW